MVHGLLDGHLEMKRQLIRYLMYTDLSPNYSVESMHAYPGSNRTERKVYMHACRISEYMPFTPTCEVSSIYGIGWSVVNMYRCLIITYTVFSIFTVLLRGHLSAAACLHATACIGPYNTYTVHFTGSEYALYRPTLVQLDFSKPIATEYYINGTILQTYKVYHYSAR